jgi:hypothetical protein
MRHGQRRTVVIGTTADAQGAGPQRAGPDGVPSRGKRGHLIDGLWRLAGGSAVDGPLGLLAVEEERLAAGRRLTTADVSATGNQNEESDSHERERL